MVKDRAWEEPNMGLKGTAVLVSKQRKVLVGQPQTITYQHQEPYMNINTRCQWQRGASKVELGMPEKGSAGTNPYTRTMSHTKQVHDDKMFRSYSARQQQNRAIEEGARAQSAKIRLESWRSAQPQVDDVARNITPQPSNLMPHHAEHIPDYSHPHRNASKVRIGVDKPGTWMRMKSTTEETHKGEPLQEPRKVFLKKDTGIKPPKAKIPTVDISRPCDGDRGKLTTTTRKEYPKKQRTQEMGPIGTRVQGHPGNKTQPEMNVCFGMSEENAKYKPPRDKSFKTAVLKGGGLHGGMVDTRDMGAVMAGSWMADPGGHQERVEKFETENRKQFKTSKNTMERQASQSITKSQVKFHSEMYHPVGPDPFATTTNDSLQQAAALLYINPHPKARFPCDRTAEVIKKEHMSGQECFGPKLNTHRLGRKDDVRTMGSGLEYNEKGINRDNGVNVVEYGKDGVWMPKKPKKRIDTKAEIITKSQIKMDHTIDQDPRWKHSSELTKGGWYSTSNRDDYGHHTSGYAKKAYKTGQVTMSSVPFRQVDDQENHRFRPYSHDQYGGDPGPAPAKHYMSDKRVVVDRARQASDMMLWRAEPTAEMFKFRSMNLERSQTKHR